MEENLHSEEELAQKKKIKNLLSLVILLAGLFIGSLLIDISQIVRGGGYSGKNLNKSDIFTANGKTWVAYEEPAVPVTVITDETCEKCDPGEALVWFRRVLPTVASIKVNYDSEEGKQLISQFEIKTLPAFIFDQAVDQTEFYNQAQVLFDPKEGKYVLNTQELGLPAGKYLELPKISEDDATFGNADSNVKVVIFSDFQCPYCKVFYSSLREVMKSYEDKVYFAYKELPLEELHPQAAGAALASECALEQGKFWEYADKLYTSQTEWANDQNITFFKKYAVSLGLDSSKFNQCLDSKKYQDKIGADVSEAFAFGISGTPAIFVNDQFEAGAITGDQLKTNIEAQLNK